MVSVSGSKMYSVNTNYSDIKAKIGGIVQLYQVISIKGKELVYKSAITSELAENSATSK